MNIPAEYQGDDAFERLLHIKENDDAEELLVPAGGPDLELSEDELGDLEEALLDGELAEELEEIVEDEPSFEEESETATKKSTGPKFKGKHSLSRDVIFNGPAFVPLNPDDYDPIYDGRSSDKMAVDPGSIFHQEATDPEEYARDKELKERVYQLILSQTPINVSAPRRKPSRVDFNKYFKLIESELRPDGFSKAKLFVELSHYFSDNLANMFKLLNADTGGEIVRELRQSANMQPLDDMDFLS